MSGVLPRVTAYTLSCGGLLLLGGRVADSWGRKRTFLVGLSGFAALLAPSALSLVTVAFTAPKERARAFGVFGALSGGGAANGLMLGGILTDRPGWRWVMWVNVPLALAIAAFAYVIVRESKSDGHPSSDLPGAALATGGMLSLVYGFTRVLESSDGWSDPLAIACLMAAVFLISTFLAVERRVKNPLLPLRIPSNPALMAGLHFLPFSLAIDVDRHGFRVHPYVVHRAPVRVAARRGCGIGAGAGAQARLPRTCAGRGASGHRRVGRWPCVVVRHSRAGPSW